MRSPMPSASPRAASPRCASEVRKSMEREAAEAIRNKLRTQVFEALQRDNQLELPKSLVDEQIQQLQIDLLQRMGRQDASQMPPREPFEEPARRRVKLGLLIGELVRRENLKVDRERVFARLNESDSLRSWSMRQGVGKDDTDPTIV